MAHPPNRSTLVGIDVSTSSVKVGLLRPHGPRLDVFRAPCRVRSPRPGWCEAAPEDWWRALRAALGAVPREDRRSVCGVGLSVLFPAWVALDRRGRPLRRAILYSDQRAAAEVDRLGGRIPLAQLEARLGNRVVPGNCSATALLWLRRHEPHVFRATHVFGHANTYLLKRLTGRFALDLCNASLTGLMPAGEAALSEDICAVFGIAPARLPPLCGSSEVVGEIAPHAARSLGLPSGVPVVAGCGDAVAATLGAGVIERGQVAYTAGSSDCFSLVLSRAPTDTRLVNCRFLGSRPWVSIATTTASGSALAWAADALFGDRPARERLPALIRSALRAGPGANGASFLPYLLGSRTPLWNPRARGAFVGLTAAVGRNDLARAVLEGATFASAQALDCLLTAHRRRAVTLIAAGGGTRSRAWLRIRAAVFRRPLRVLRVSETSTLGAAMLAGLGAGVFRTVEEAVRATEGLRGGVRVAPDPELVDRYRPLYRAFSKAQRIALAGP